MTGMLRQSSMTNIIPFMSLTRVPSRGPSTVHLTPVKTWTVGWRPTKHVSAAVNGHSYQKSRFSTWCLGLMLSFTKVTLISKNWASCWEAWLKLKCQRKVPFSTFALWIIECALSGTGSLPTSSRKKFFWGSPKLTTPHTRSPTSNVCLKKKFLIGSQNQSWSKMKEGRVNKFIKKKLRLLHLKI